ncbi:MAG TPA: FG-GAP-like repeat-containing protein [Bryobacteraceae bacterium]|nr:FG-GAP-like repeat-containing protein [Bryobacteraceae bacterium]
MQSSVYGFGFQPVTGSVSFTSTAQQGSVATATIANSSFNFLQTSYPGPSAASAIAVGDLNGDGFPDVVVGNGASGGVTVWLANPFAPGTFQAPVVYASQMTIAGIRIADLNRDGAPDIVFTIPSYYSVGAGIAVLYGNPNAPGQFQPASVLVNSAALSALGVPVGLAVGDFNNDGFLDVAMAPNIGIVPDIVQMFFGDGAGSLTAGPQISLPTVGACAIEAADLNNDGLPDLVVYLGGSPAILLNNRSQPGTFSISQVQTERSQYSPLGVFLLKIVDMNGDGLPDLVAGGTGAQGLLSPVAGVLLGDSAHPGQFLAPQTYALTTTPSQIGIGDVNGDGLPDLLVGDTSGGISALLNDPSNPGGLLPQQLFAVASEDSAYIGDVDTFAFSDLNGDGVPDMVAAVPITSKLQVFLGAQVARVTATAMSLPALQQTLIAHYGGDTNYQASSSPALTIGAPANAATVALSASASSIAFGAALTLTATVTLGSNPVTEGTVGFYEGSKLLGVAAVTSTTGIASLTSLALDPGVQNLTAVFSGAPNAPAAAGPGTSPAMQVTVTGTFASVAELTIVPRLTNPYQFDLTATVSDPSAITPSGAVTFTDSTTGSVLGTAQLTPLSKQPSFGIPIDIPTGGFGTAVAVGDFNNDAVPDFVSFNGSSSLTLFLGNAEHPGTFTAQPSISLSGSISGYPYLSLSAADFNGDGMLDLAVATGSGVAIYFGDPAHPGNLVFSQQIPIANASAVAVADFNRDGVPDLITWGLNSSGFNVAFGDPAHRGQFLPSTGYSLPILSEPTVAYVVDFNGDGLPDVLLDRYLFLNDSTHPGTFLSPIAIDVPSGQVLAVQDLNNDGIPDLVLGINDASGFSVCLGVNSQPGTFDCTQSSGANLAQVETLAVADFNGDGLPDLAMNGAGGIYVTLGDSQHPGQFLPGPTFALPSTAGGTAELLPADLNGDGIPDLLYVNNSTPDTFLFINTSESTAQAKLTGITLSANGANSIIASYGGDTVNAMSSSTPVNIAQAQNSVTSLQVQPNAVIPGTVVVLKAAVTVNGSPVTAGTVAFKDVSGRLLGTAQVVSSGPNAGTAAFSSIGLSAASTCIAAYYSGAPNAALSAGPSQSSSACVNVSAAKGKSVVTLGLDIKTGNWQAVVTGFGTAVPSGTVSLLDQTNCCQPLASVTLPSSPVSTYSYSTSFLSPAGYTAGTPQITDVNNDGVPDVVEMSKNGVVVFYADPSNPGQFAATANFLSGGTPSSFTLADFNGDGLIDIAITNKDTNTVSILLNQPSQPGQFQLAASLAVGTQPVAIVQGDFNGDGLPDLVVANNRDKSLTVLLNDSASPGQFNARPPIALSSAPYVVATGDLNHDGSLDLAVGANIGVITLAGDPDNPGAFLPPQVYMATGFNDPVVTQIFLVDLNRDGNLDLLYTGGPFMDVFSRLADPNNPGVFGAETPLLQPEGPSYLTVTDFNGDGLPDLIESLSGEGQISVSENDPAHPGQFLPPQTLLTTFGGPIALADMNGDGILDVVSDSEEGITLYLPSSTVSADFAALSTFGPSRQIYVQYSGDTNYQGSVSNSVSAGGTLASTTITMTPPGTQLTAGALSAFTVSVASPYAIPQGTITLYDSGTALARLQLDATGTAVFNISSLAMGSHSVSAQYEDNLGTPLWQNGYSNSLTVSVAGLNLPASTFIAVPNPIQVAPGAVLGATTLEWNEPPGTAVEIHLGSPTGPIFAAGGSSGTAPTGDWVVDGMTFYLQDITGGKALIAANTLATVVAHVPQAIFTATQNPIPVQPGQLFATATLQWNAPSAASVEIHVGSPAGVLFAAGGWTGTAETLDWVTDGMTFYLQDVTNGKPLTSDNTIAALTMHLQTQVEFSAFVTMIQNNINRTVSQVADLSWNAPGVQEVQVHVGSPTGPLFADYGGQGSAETGPWITDGMTFYLQDVSGGKPLTPENTLATTVIHLSSPGFSFFPNRISASASMFGSTEVVWNAPTASQVEIHLGSPDGVLFAAGGPVGEAFTGAWVTDGMAFYLQDVSGGKPLTIANTLSMIVAHLSTRISAAPNPIPVANGATFGSTTLYWDAPGATTVQVRVGAPDGPLFAESGPYGSGATGDWVTSGMTFYLQDVSGNKPLTSQYTLGSVTLGLQPPPLLPTQ